MTHSKNNKIIIYISFLFIVCFFLSGVNLYADSAFTVQDIFDGIEMRRSKISDFDMTFSLNHKNTDRLYAKYGEKASDETPFPGYAAIVLKGQELSENFQIFEKDNKKAYIIYDSDPTNQTPVVLSKAVFDGEIEKYLQMEELRGSIQRKEPDDFYPFETIPDILGLNEIDIVNYVNHLDDFQVVSEKVINDDMIVELSLKIRKLQKLTNKNVNPPRISYPQEALTEFIVHINASKDSWPIKIEKYLGATEFKTGKSIRVLLERTEVEDFIKSNGIYVPTSIQKEYFETDYKKVPGSLIPEISETYLASTKKLNIEHIVVNSGLTDDVFTFDFPDGTRYVDKLLGTVVRVGSSNKTLIDFMENTLLDNPSPQRESKLDVENKIPKPKKVIESQSNLPRNVMESVASGPKYSIYLLCILVSVGGLFLGIYGMKYVLRRRQTHE